MTTKQMIISEDTYYRDLVLIVVFGILSFIGCYYFISCAYETPYPQLVLIILGVIVGLFGIWILSKSLEFDTINVYLNEVRIISILGYTKKTFKLDETTIWFEIEKSHRNAKWKILKVFNANQHIKLNSSYYANYQELKQAITQHATEDSTRQNKYKKRQHLYSSVIMYLLATPLIILTITLICSLDREIHQSETKTLIKTVVLDAQISNSKNGRSLHLKLKEFPDFNFSISGTNYKASYSDNFISHFNYGDTLDIDILKNEYLTKLTKERTPSFLEKSVNYSFINVYGLRNKKDNYLTLRDINIEDKKNKNFGIIFFPLLALIFIVFGTYDLYKFNKLQ